VSLADAPRRAARYRGDPHGLLDPGDEALRVGILALFVRPAASHVHDGAPVRREAEARELLAIVVAIARDRLTAVVGRGGHPDVASAAGVEDPRDRAARGGGDELLGVGRAEKLREGGGRLLGAEDRGDQGEQGEPADSSNHGESFLS